jgi:beta-glucosidase
MANYYGVSEDMVTLLEGIAGKLAPGTLIQYKQGFLLDRESKNPKAWSSGEAKDADAVIVCMGIAPLLEGEEVEALASPTLGDRLDLNLPANQIAFLRRLRKKIDKPIIAVLTGGSPITVPEVHELADAVLFAWYPGEQGGDALGDILFGEVSPSGRLPITFPKSVDQLPDYADYALAGRTYRYFNEDPLYPFGFGLSYSTFAYGDIEVNKTPIQKGEMLQVTVTVVNTGDVAAEEIVQLYLTDEEASVVTPQHALKDFKRVYLKPGEHQKIAFTVTPAMMAMVDNSGQSRIEPGRFKVTMGGCSPGQRGVALGASTSVKAYFTVK